MENKPVSGYVLEILGLNEGEKSRLMAVRRMHASGDAVSTIACGLKHIERKPITMRTMVNESKFCVDDHDGVVFILANQNFLPQKLHKWLISVDDTVLHVYQVKSIVYRTVSSKAFMDIPIRIKVFFFYSF